MSNVLKAKEDMQKSPEQLEQEKIEIINSRLSKLALDGRNKDFLIRQVCVYIDDYLYAILMHNVNILKRLKNSFKV